MIRVAIADDHQVVRQGVRAVLLAQPGFEVVGEAENGDDALRLVKALRPDVLIADLTMPGLGGADLTKQTAEASHGTKVIVLSMHASHEHVLLALKAGAAGYVVKGAGSQELVDAVHRVSAGERYVSPAVSGVLIDASLRPRDEPLDPFDTLSDREREVLTLVAEGMPGPEIAARLFISPRTVENHRASLLKKLSLRNQADLIKYAIRRGLVSLDG